MSDLTVKSLAAEVPFKVEQLVTRDGTRVDERRETCWMADEGIGGLAYSGKVMAPTPFTPLVDSLRDLVFEKTGQRFDCALLNLYPERSVACKYHKDPDLGRLWARDSVIVSVGETRRFAFREETGLPLSGRTRGDGKQKLAGRSRLQFGRKSRINVKTSIFGKNLEFAENLEFQRKSRISTKISIFVKKGGVQRFCFAEMLLSFS